MDDLTLARARGPHFNDAELARAPQSESTNVGSTERWVSGLGGTFLIAAGLRRGSFPGLGMALLGGGLVYRAVTGQCQAYQMLGIDTSDHRSGEAAEHSASGREIKHSVTIERSADDLYQFWRNIENAPRFMLDVDSVQRTDDRTSHWVTKGPLGSTLEWDSQLIHDAPGQLIGWETLPGSDIVQTGSVRFTPATGGRGTVVTLEIHYEPPAGVVGLTVARLLGKNPDHNAREDLRRFKQLMEAGELATVDGQPSGRV